jgi:cell wall-associated NlpC family hydrolase
MTARSKLIKATIALSASLLIASSVPANVTHAAELHPTPATVKVNGVWNYVIKQFQLIQNKGNSAPIVMMRKTAAPAAWSGMQMWPAGSGTKVVNKANNAGIKQNTIANTPKVSNTNNTVANSTTAYTPATEQGQSSYRMMIADKIIQTGEKYLGTPYQYGAPAGQTRTFDCSSFVQFVYGQNGINLPRSSREQAHVGQTVPLSQIQKGDLLFFTAGRSDGQIGHVGIYAGNNKVLHTWGPGGVRYDSLNTPWLKQTLVLAKRVIPDHS